MGPPVLPTLCSGNGNGYFLLKGSHWRDVNVSKSIKQNKMVEIWTVALQLILRPFDEKRVFSYLPICKIVTYLGMNTQKLSIIIANLNNLWPHELSNIRTNLTYHNIRQCRYNSRSTQLKEDNFIAILYLVFIPDESFPRLRFQTYS